jgi:transketolase
VEAEWATRAIYRRQGTCYLRLGRGGEPRIHERLDSFEIGKAIKVKDGGDIVLLSTGGIFDEVLKARDLLAQKGIDAALYTFPTVKPIDRETIAGLAESYPLIVTVEEHNIVGGFGGAIAEVLAEQPKREAQLLRIGLGDVYSSVVGSQKYLRDYYGLSAEKIAARVEGALIEKGFDSRK